jgi:hypothetical protein
MQTADFHLLLISTYQVEMEYKKNRQRVIITDVGKVTKKNRKTVEVLGGMSNGVFNTRYRVSASMLEPA